MVYLPKKEVEEMSIDQGTFVSIEQIDNGFIIKKKETNTIYTIGYEGLAFEEFLEFLIDNKIEQLLDIRELAISRKNGFSKGRLNSYLREAGIRYKHMSSLGSPKNIRHELRENWNYKRFFKEYREHMKDDEDIINDLTDLEGLSKMRKTAIMCYEQDWTKCHRRIICEELHKRGWKIIHLNTPRKETLLNTY